MLLNQFEEFVKKKNLFRPEEKILLALSGGVDSMVMAALFYRANFSFAVSHVNFQLRGAESDADADFVGQWAEGRSIPFFMTTVDTQGKAQESGESIQMVARQLRYAWLAEIARKHYFDKIATAHHAHDALETALLNFVKGTGVAGLKGIAAKKGNLVRPLLFASKDQIRAYAQAEGLTWREDDSNQKTDYQRNFIRLEIIPRLENINPALVQTYAHTAERLEATEELVRQHQQKLENQALRQEEGVMFISIPLFAQSEAPLLFLSRLLQRYGFSYRQSREIWQNRAGQAGQLFQSKKYDLFKDRHEWAIALRLPSERLPALQIQETDREVCTPHFCLQTEVRPQLSPLSWPRDAWTALLDFERLRFPLTLRLWQTGDYFYPLGMSRRKKLSDFLIDAKVPVWAKSRVWVLCSGEEIVWVVGHRISERFKMWPHSSVGYQLKKREDALNLEH